MIQSSQFKDKKYAIKSPWHFKTWFIYFLCETNGLINMFQDFLGFITLLIIWCYSFFFSSFAMLHSSTGFFYNNILFHTFYLMYSIQLLCINIHGFSKTSIYWTSKGTGGRYFIKQTLVNAMSFLVNKFFSLLVTWFLNKILVH